MKRFAYLSAIVLVSLLLVACGGGASDGGSQTQTVSLSFDGTDMLQWEPATATAPAGATVEVVVNNSGVLEHDWLLVPESADVLAQDLTSQMVNEAHSGIVAGGESKSFTFTAPSAGTYKFVCTVPGHAAAGMVGTLTVN